MPSSLPDLKFQSIRSLNGKQTDGFEELSVQLFRGETKGLGEFFRIEGSGGDGGVEAYRVRPDGSKVAIQSKYWDTLETTQWRQLTSSVKSALKNHRTLNRYIVSTPLNRTPAKTKKWETLKADWLKHARSLGITQSIDFEWWGHSELGELLVKEVYRNQLVYWLGLPEFSLEWLEQVNRSHIAILGKRYSPQQHIDTDSGVRLEAFAWGEHGKSRIKKAFVKLAERWREVQRLSWRKAADTEGSKNFALKLQELIIEVRSFRLPETGYPSIRPFVRTCKLASDTCGELHWKLRELDQREREAAEAESGVKQSYQSGSFGSAIHSFSEFSSAIQRLLDAAEVCEFADDNKLLLLGEAGSGKSHLIADLVTTSSNRSQPALLLLGECFLGSSEPWQATKEVLGWTHSADDLLAALDQEAIIAGRPALVCVDALNESENRRLWQSHLVQFAERVSRYSHVKLLVSCRSDFSRITLPDTVRPGSDSSWPAIRHHGFGAEVIEAIEIYFDAFNVQSPHFPPVLAEFQNPLFLRVFCEAFEGRETPSGPIGLDQVMRARMDRLCEQIRKEIDCDPDDTREAVRLIAREIAAKGGQPIPRRNAREITADCFPQRESTRSLYQRLLSNGMLVESVSYSANLSVEDDVVVRFPFERFSDYFIASLILDGVHDADGLKVLFAEEGRISKYKEEWTYYENRGVARSLAILAPERYGVELAEILVESEVLGMVLVDFLESLAWRGPNSFTEKTVSILDEARRYGIDIIPTYFRLSTIPLHPFNSEYLGNRLKQVSLSDRELAWTIPISNISVWGDSGDIGDFIDWCFRAPVNLVSNEQALLAGRLLLWLCTSNHRALRKRATLAAIRILLGRPNVVCQLIDELSDVDDPYLVERLYAVASGIAMRLNGGDGLSALAESVHKAVFGQVPITPNVLIRDFASSVLEACASKGCLPETIASSAFRPPFRSAWPDIPSEKDVKRFEDDEAWNRICSSLRTEDMGWYGDFGRYVMQAKVRCFSDRQLAESPPDSDYRKDFPGRVARRFVLKRVEELGWTGDLFRDYERDLPSSRMRHGDEEFKLERISKKYQWIALYEFLGHLSDHYWLEQTWQTQPLHFAGAWQIWAREFDPSQSLKDLESEDSEESDRLDPWKGSYPSPFLDDDLCDDREAWVTTTPEDFAPLINTCENNHGSEQQWLVIAGHHEWIEPEYERVVADRRGKLKMWVNIRSFLVRKENLEAFLGHAQDTHFYGQGCGFPEDHNGWIGEYPWGTVYEGLTEQCRAIDSRVGDAGVPYTITSCDWNEGSSLIPSPQLCKILELEWASEGAKFRTSSGERVIKHLNEEAKGWAVPIAVEKTRLRAALDREGIEIVWCVLSERSCWCSETTSHITGKELEASAVYWLDGMTIQGGVTKNKIQDLNRLR